MRAYPCLVSAVRVASYNDGIYRSDLASVLYNSSFGTERLEILWY